MIHDMERTGARPQRVNALDRLRRSMNQGALLKMGWSFACAFPIATSFPQEGAKMVGTLEPQLLRFLWILDACDRLARGADSHAQRLLFNPGGCGDGPGRRIGIPK